MQGGAASEFADCYDPSWWRFEARTKPTVGNHDYRTSGAFGYLGSASADPAKGH